MNKSFKEKQGILSIPKKTRFTECLIRANSLIGINFKEWVFYTGMLFRSDEKWWEKHGKRTTLHEGLDLCLFRDIDNNISRLEMNTKVPAMFDGVVKKIVDDFLGKSIIIEHTHKTDDKNRFCTLYAHTIPSSYIHTGAEVRKGDIIATIACTEKAQSGMLSHLHISVGQITQNISYEKLSWSNINTSGDIVLVDPLEVIDWKYVVIESAPFPSD